MNIYWYNNVGDNEKLLFESDGELPKVDELVYLHDNKSMIRTKYRVVKAYHSITIQYFKFSEILDKIDNLCTSPEHRFNKMDLYIKENIGYPFSYEFQKQLVNVSVRRGEVFLEKM